MLLLCSVMPAVPVPSKNCLEYNTIFFTAVRCGGCITEHKQAVPHSVCVCVCVHAERYFITISTEQDIHHFYQIL